MSIETPWGPSQTIERLSPCVSFVTTASHGGVMLSATLLAQLPDYLETGFSGDRKFWEEDCDWGIPYLMFTSHFEKWGPVVRHGHEKMREYAIQAVKYKKSWLSALVAMNCITQEEAAG